MSTVLLMAAAGCALAAYFIDQHLQAHRAPDAPPAAFVFVPLRLDPSLYLPEKRPLVIRGWLFLGGMVLSAVLALAAG